MPIARMHKGIGQTQGRHLMKSFRSHLNRIKGMLGDKAKKSRRVSKMGYLYLTTLITSSRRR